MRQVAGIFVLLLVLGVAVLGAGLLLTVSGKKGGYAVNQKRERPDGNDFTITVVFDNFPFKDELETAWGFSAVVNTPKENILFDTGGSGDILLRNMKKMRIDPNSIDIVVLSHIHGDHTGGLFGFLRKNPDVKVFIPAAFPEKFKKQLSEYTTEITQVKQATRICKNVYSTGQLGLLIKEQGLVLRATNGIVLITGCAHPGVVNMVKAAKKIFPDEVLFVMGGFHLEWSTKGKIKRVVSNFRKLSVQFAGPSHCTGEKAREIFQQEYKDHFIKIGAGKIIKTKDLKN